jgi:hypothetical protein
MENNKSELKEKLVEYLKKTPDTKWKTIGNLEFEVSEIISGGQNTRPMVAFKGDDGNRNSISVEEFIRINNIPIADM